MKKLAYAFALFVFAFLFASNIALRAQGTTVLQSWDFESSMSDWKSGTGNATIELSADKAHGGTKSLKLVKSNTSTEINLQNDVYKPLEGQTLSFWVYISAADAANLNGLQIFWQEGAGWSWKNKWINGSDVTPDAWYQASVTLPALASPLQRIGLQFTGKSGTAASSVTMYVDDIEVTGAGSTEPEVAFNWGFLGGRIGGRKLTASEDGKSVDNHGTTLSGWSAIRGGFKAPVTGTTDANGAVVVKGKITFVGQGPEAWSSLRYGLFRHDSVGTLLYPGTDSAKWSGRENYAYGYMFTPQSGTVYTGNIPSGINASQCITNGGSWISTFGGAVGFGGLILQAPARAVMSAGTYSFAISVHPLANGTKKVNFYLIKDGTPAPYWYGGSLIDTTKIASTFNGVSFGIQSITSNTSVAITDLEVGLGPDVTVPEAPWQAYYVDKWGFLGGRQGNWKFKPDPDGVIGNAAIGGDASLSVEWGAIRGEFIAPITATTSKAIIVTGNIEFEGAGIDTWSGLRYGLFMHDAAGTLITTNVDSTRWSGSESSSHGYMFTPISGSNRVTDGASGGLGTQWIRVSGNYISTSTGSGPVYSGGVANQKPARAVAGPGKYAFAFAVQPLADGTKKVRFYLIKGTAAQSAKATYYFGGEFIDTTKMAPTFNGLVFAVHATGSGANPDLRGVKLTDVKVDIGTPFELPEAPWQAYYVDTWGFYGNKTGGWSLTPGEIVGDVTISGTKPAQDGLSVVRGGFIDPLTPTTSKALVVSGKIELVGGGFESWCSLRYGLFYDANAGTVTNNAWTGTGLKNTGYLFMPRGGKTDIVYWPGAKENGTWGGIVNGEWFYGNGANDYPLGNQTQKPASVVTTAGTYEFAISIAPQADGTTEVRQYLVNEDKSYYWAGKAIDTHKPAPTDKFNSIIFGMDNTMSTTGMLIHDVKVDLGSPIVIPPDPTETGVEGTDLLPAEYALDQNYPNPFNPTTTIEFALPKDSNVKLVVYDVLGRVVSELVSGQLNAGKHKVEFNGSNLASGIYFYSIKAGDFTSVKKLMLLK